MFVIERILLHASEGFLGLSSSLSNGCDKDDDDSGKLFRQFYFANPHRFRIAIMYDNLLSTVAERNPK